MKDKALMKLITFNRITVVLLGCACLLTASALSSCSDDESSSDEPAPVPVKTINKATAITDKDKLAMIYSLVDLEGDGGRIYEMNYTVDYKLDEALNFGIDGSDKLTAFVVTKLFDRMPGSRAEISYDAGCSAFAVTDARSGHPIMGRNFDFNHLVNGTRIPIPLIAVHTAPKGGKKSVSFVDGLMIGYTKGFYNDRKDENDDKGSDLSLLMAAPYLLLDGINEDGFAVSVLKLDGKPTKQGYDGRKKIFTTVAMRMLLDRVSTVAQAVEMLKEYNMNMDKDEASYHFFMADAKGDYAIVEYVDSNLEVNPSKMDVLTGDDKYRYVTNFYVSPEMAGTIHGSELSTHGKDRYLDLKSALEECGYRMSCEQAMSLLEKVAQGPESQRSTGFTQWSEVFDLTAKTVKLSILREYEKSFSFNINN